MGLSEWVGLGYFIPSTPSKGRVYVWRRLKALGAQLIRPGVAALPNNQKNVELFKELSEKITESLGEAILIEFNFLTDIETANLRKKFLDASKKQYREMLDCCARLLEKLDSTGISSERFLLEDQLIKTISSYRQNTMIGGHEKTVELPDSTLTDIFRTLGGIPLELRTIIENLKGD